MDHPLPYPTAEQLQTILTELRQDELHRAQREREYDQIKQDPDLSEEQRRRALAPLGVQARAAEQALRQSYRAWLGDRGNDLTSELFDIDRYLERGIIAVDIDPPPTLAQIQLACALLWIEGMAAMRVRSRVYEVWTYLKVMAEERRVYVTRQQRKAANDLLKQLAKQTLPRAGKGPYSKDRAPLWVPAMRRYYDQELPKIEAIFQQHKSVAERAQTLHAAYPDIPLDDFVEWIDPKPRRGQPAPTHHTAILMTRRVAAWQFGMDTAEAFRQLLARFPNPSSPPRPDWLPGSPVQPWPRLSERALRRPGARAWAIQRGRGAGEHGRGEELLTFDQDGVAVTSRWQTVLQVLPFPEMFRVRPFNEDPV